MGYSVVAVVAVVLLGRLPTARIRHFHVARE